MTLAGSNHEQNSIEFPISPISDGFPASALASPFTSPSPSAPTFPSTPSCPFPTTPISPGPSSSPPPSILPFSLQSFLIHHRPPLDPSSILHAWLIHSFLPDPSFSHFIPQVDILVAIKALTDRLKIPPLDRSLALEIVRRSFPCVRFSSRLTSPIGLRSNHELVLSGITFNFSTLPNQQQLSLDSFNLRHPFPPHLASPVLTEALRQRICDLEDCLIAEIHRNHSSSDSSLLLNNSQSRLLGLGDRIWNQFLASCLHPNVFFHKGRSTIISWYDTLDQYGFDLIRQHINPSKSTDYKDYLGSQSILVIYSPFSTPNELFRASQFPAFERIVSDRIAQQEASSSGVEGPVRGFGAARLSKNGQLRDKLRLSSLNLLKSSNKLFANHQQMETVTVDQIQVEFDSLKQTGRFSFTVRRAAPES